MGSSMPRTKQMREFGCFSMSAPPCASALWLRGGVWIDGCSSCTIEYLRISYIRLPAVGGLNFHSTAYDWLVVNRAATHAQCKGSGRVSWALAPNGRPYKFTLWATDGSSSSIWTLWPMPSSSDTFRIKIVCVSSSGVDSVLLSEYPEGLS